MTAAEERSESLVALLNEEFGANAHCSRPSEKPGAEYVFDLPGLGKRIVVSEVVYDIWPSTREGLQNMIRYHDFFNDIRNAAPGEHGVVETADGKLKLKEHSKLQ